MSDDKSLLRKLDLLLGKEKKRPLPGASCDFTKFGREDLSTKRTWEFADKVDDKFVEIINALEEGSAEEAKELAVAGRKMCEEKAQVAHIAFVDGWAVAKHFENVPYEESFSVEDQKKLKRARTEAKSSVDLDSDTD